MKTNVNIEPAPDERLVLVASYGETIAAACRAKGPTLATKISELRKLHARMGELIADYGSVPDALRRNRP
ncbi:MAG: hypothetical protein AB7T37_07755 [Dehalococcoidia bacterium]